MKGLAFKILSPKDITGVLTMIGVHPPVSVDSVDRPSGDVAMSVYQNLAEFAYDMDAQQIKAQVPHMVQFAEIYDEAMDVLTIFKLSRQLSMINLVDDFSFKDIWEPNPKRFRAVISGMINFCRYKEAKVIVITGMKEDVHVLDGERLELVDRSNQLEQELGAAQDRHNSELHEIWAAEGEAQEAHAIVEKLQRQLKSAERVVEETEEKLGACKDRVVQHDQDMTLAREQAASLREQIADSPEGLEQEILELRHRSQQQKAFLEEKVDERRSRVQREQVLNRLVQNLVSFRDDLVKVGQAHAAAEAAHERTTEARDDLAALRQTLDQRREQEADLELAVRQVTAELERAKQAHEERVLQLEARRQQALVQHQELQAKRTEEQKQHHQLLTQRLELEAEVAGARRSHEAETNDLRAQQKAIVDAGEAYAQSLEAMLGQLPEQAPSFAAPPALHAKPNACSPDLASRRRRNGLSPSPVRLGAGASERWLLSPGF